mgnify:CR=1 FL=1
MYRGDSKTFDLTFTSSNGTTLNITGYTIFFTVKNKNSYYNEFNDSSALVSVNVTSHTNATSGLSQVNISPSDTSTIAPGTYIYDMQLKDATGKVLTFIGGNFVLVPDVTRRTV